MNTVIPTQPARKTRRNASLNGFVNGYQAFEDRVNAKLRRFIGILLLTAGVIWGYYLHQHRELGHGDLVVLIFPAMLLGFIAMAPAIHKMRNHAQRTFWSHANGVAMGGALFGVFALSYFAGLSFPFGMMGTLLSGFMVLLGLFAILRR